jgi:hypothetical protein
MAKVNTQNPEYLGAVNIWNRCRAFTAGSDRVKDGGEVYLTKLGGQDAASYEAYKSRAQFFNATGRTVEGMAGLVMRVDPTVDLPPQLADLVDDVDYQGTSLFEFSKQQVTETLTVGRSGILVDFPTRDLGTVTQAQAQAQGLRPYLAHYPAESIYNWKSERVNGATVLTRVVLMEQVEIQGEDEFTTDTEIQFRVLLLEDNKYIQRIYVSGEKDDWIQKGADIIPLKGGVALTQIMFVFIGSETNTPNVQKPPVADLVSVNLGHYRNSADHEHGLHFTALPTPVITGHSIGSDESIAIGSESFLVIKNPLAKAYFMEFTGAGLAPIQTAMDKKESQMATLGARMLSEDKKGVEAAETAKIHRSGENGVLSSLAGSVTKGIRRALEMAADWANASSAVEFELNKDFMPVGMAPGMLKELLAAWQSGGISMPVLFDNLKRGEVINSETDLATMQDDIDNNLPGAGEPEPAPGTQSAE